MIRCSLYKSYSKAWCELREHCAHRRRLAVNHMKGDSNVYTYLGNAAIPSISFMAIFFTGLYEVKSVQGVEKLPLYLLVRCASQAPDDGIRR